MTLSPPNSRRAASRGTVGTILTVALLVALALVPLYARVQASPFLITLITRVLVFAIAALSLNLILGYGGLVSFGHALYLGLGVYSAAICSFYGFDNGWLQLLIAIAACAVVAAVTGSIALRTRGIAFIMITLAFAQMFFFLFVSLSQFGGDDGLRLKDPSRFGALVLTDPRTLYFSALFILCAAMYLCRRLVHSRFGVVVRAAKLNEQRMQALGFPTFRYRLAAYVLSAMLCGIAGILYVNLTQFASPSYMSWETSGEIIVMVMLGGISTLAGPLLGALAMILTEEWLKSLTQHWMVIFGPLIILVVVTSRQGIVGLLQKPAGRLSRDGAAAPAASGRQP